MGSGECVRVFSPLPRRVLLAAVSEYVAVDWNAAEGNSLDAALEYMCMGRNGMVIGARESRCS